MDALILFLRPRLNDLTYTLQHIQQPSPAEIGLLTATCLFLAAFSLQGKLWDRPDPHAYIYYQRPQLKSGIGPGAAASPSTAQDAARQLDELKKDVVVFWGSQSGTAESLAGRLSRNLQTRFGLNVLTADLSDYDAASISGIPASKIAIFVLATYGEGGPSDNATEFWSWITGGKLRDLSRLRFLAFGLGNSNYKYYNKVVDEVEAKLRQAGATLLSPVGRADEAEGTTEEDYLSWVDDVHAALIKHLGVQPKPPVYVPAVTVERAPDQPSSSPRDIANLIIDFRDRCRTSDATSATKPLPIHRAVNISGESAADGRCCLHVELDLDEFPDLRYKTGDHVAVWPVNPDDEVDLVLAMLGRADDADTPIRLGAEDPSTKLKLADTTTLRTLLRHQLEICGPISRGTLAELVQFAPSDESRAFLDRLGRDRAAFAQLQATSHVTFGRILQRASGGTPWTGLPLSYVVDAIPALQPRYYSVSSSSVLSPRRLSMTVRVSHTALATPQAAVPGLASSYLLALSDASSASPYSYNTSGESPLTPHRRLHCQIRRTRFKLPSATATPIIMIANGTGIAPFRAFIQERARLHAVGRAVGPMVLFYGCRHPDTDCFYRDELEAARLSLGGGDGPEPLLVIRRAFSRLEGTRARDGNEGLRGYVQDAVAMELSRIIDMLDRDNANIYLCGGASMAREVSKRLSEGYSDLRDVSVEQGGQWVAGLKRTTKWKEDVWD